MRRLSRKHRPLILAGLGNGKYLGSEGIRRTKDLDWWRGIQLSEDVRITFVPSQHFSARGMCDRNTSLWGGYVIESTGHKVYFAGDTGFGPHFKQIRKRFGPVSLALLPIGAFRPRWFMSPVHISPAEAVKAHRILEARHSLAIHFGTFQLGDDGQDEPVRELRKAMKKAGVSGDRFWVLEFGRGRMVPEAAPRAEAAPRPTPAPRPAAAPRP